MCAVVVQVVVFNIEGRDIPIVHRSIKVHERREDGPPPHHMDILTKARPARPLQLPLPCCK